MHGPIRIADILNRSIFNSARSLTEEAGMQRLVRWVHVMEVEHPGPLLHGGELVLTTGVAFRDKPVQFIEFLTELIEHDAAGLCLELGTGFAEVSDEIIALAKDCDFPLIIFAKQVKFVDITQDIHGLILSRHHRILDDLEELNEQLHLYLTGRIQLLNVLDQVRDITEATIVYERSADEPLIVPGSTSAQKLTHAAALQLWQTIQQRPLPSVISSQTYRSESVVSEYGLTLLSQPILVFGTPQGTLHMLAAGHPEEIDERLKLVLDKTASALAHEAFRRLSIHERQLVYEQDSVERLIRGAEQSTTEMQTLGFRRTSSRVFCVAILTPVAVSNHRSNVTELTEDDGGSLGWLHQRLDIAMSVRMALTGGSLKCAMTVRKDRVVMILQHPFQRQWHNELTRALNRIASTFSSTGLSTSKLLLAVGSSGTPVDIALSYRQAERVLDYARVRRITDTSVIHYHNLGVYRWLWLSQESSELSALLESDIAEILEYDARHNSSLLSTLRVYLDCNLSKQQTAQRLSIHRQTLYHRLGQIESLLGSKLEDPIQRLSLHLALYALELPHG